LTLAALTASVALSDGDRAMFTYEYCGVNGFYVWTKDANGYNVCIARFDDEDEAIAYCASCEAKLAQAMSK
jgi:hypothetical protein